MKMARRILTLGLTMAFIMMSFTNTNFAAYGQEDTIITDNVVKLQETVSPAGFVHPGIGTNAVDDPGIAVGKDLFDNQRVAQCLTALV